MRAFVSALSSLLILAGLGSATATANSTPGRLESIRILPAGANSSLVLQTSAAGPFIATTAADARTLIIELVGISADRHERSLSTAARLISHIAIDTLAGGDRRIVTKIRVSLAGPFRSRLRVAGNLVYVDFERRVTSQAVVPPKQRPAAARGGAAPAMPSTLDARAASADVPADASLAGGDTVEAERPPDRSGPEPDILKRLPALTAWLQHTSSPTSGTHTPEKAWIPLVLKDGAVVFSYGEYAQLDARVVLPLPLDDSNAPRMQVVSLPASAIDVEATSLAAESVRTARYAVTRGEADFAQLGEEVTKIFSAVPSAAGSAARVNLIEAARRRLVEWPAAHYWYRARDVIEAVVTLDEILGQLRGAAGARNFNLSLLAAPEVLPLSITVRQPTLIDLLENAVRLVSLLDLSAERTVLLRATVEAFERHRSELPPLWLATRKRSVTAMLQDELRVDRAYRELTLKTIERAGRAASNGDVNALLQLRSALIERDRHLGGKRLDAILAATTTLDVQFGVAAQERLRRDYWATRSQTFRAYANAVEQPLKRFEAVKTDLRRIGQSTTTPDFAKTVKMLAAVDSIRRVLAASRPPEELADAHGLFLTAAQLATVAAQERFDAAGSRGTEAMTRGSAAAAASLTTFDRGRQALQVRLRVAASP